MNFIVGISPENGLVRLSFYFEIPGGADGVVAEGLLSQVEEHGLVVIPFRSFGKNLIGLEDTRGGGDRDYDDLILQFSFSKGSVS